MKSCQPRWVGVANFKAMLLVLACILPVQLLLEGISVFRFA
jgi:hypothetical protein